MPLQGIIGPEYLGMAVEATISVAYHFDTNLFSGDVLEILHYISICVRIPASEAGVR